MSPPRKSEPALSEANSDARTAPAAPPERADFLNEAPDSPELRPLIDAFVAGNYAELRRGAAALRQSEVDEEVIEFAEELILRTEPSRTAKTLLYLSIGFFLFLVAWVYIGHAV